MCSPRGRSIAAKPVIIRKFHKTVQPLIPKADRRGAEPLSCPSAGHAAPQPRSAFGSRHRWPARPATAFLAFLMNAHGFGQEASIRADLLGRRDFGGCWPGFRLRRWRGGGASTATTGAGQALSHLFAAALLRTTGLGAESAGTQKLQPAEDPRDWAPPQPPHWRPRRWPPGQTLPPASKRLVAQPHFGDDVIRHRRLACIQPPARTRHRHESNRSHSPQRKLLWRRGTAARAC